MPAGTSRALASGRSRYVCRQLQAAVELLVAESVYRIEQGRGARRIRTEKHSHGGRESKTTYYRWYRDQRWPLRDSR
jgi:hypothetical protein